MDRYSYLSSLLLSTLICKNENIRNGDNIFNKTKIKENEINIIYKKELFIIN